MKPRSFFLCTLTLAFVSGLCTSAMAQQVSPTPQGTPAPLNWSAGTDLPAARSQSAIEPGSTFLSGGSTSAEPLRGLYEFYSFGGPIKWIYSNTQMDSTRLGPGMGLAVRGWPFIFGGKASNGNVLDTSGAFVNYFSERGNFQARAKLNTARWWMAYASDKSGQFGRVYAIGGLDKDGKVLASVERYDDSNNTWTLLAPLPQARYAFGASRDLSGDHIFVFGGGSTNSQSSVSLTVYRYTIGTNTWDTVAPMPIATRESAVTLSPEGFIYVIGGASSTALLSAVQIYNPATNTWTSDTSLPVAIRSANAVFVGGFFNGHMTGEAEAGMPSTLTSQLHIIGGINASNQNVASVWVGVRANTAATPTFTSRPVTVAKFDTPYSYQAIATGRPTPTYSLTSKPTGMTIDALTGRITWTPTLAQVGAQNVTVHATNSAGSADQSFTINVAGPPPTAPSELKASNVTTNSVTLTWKASTAQVGTITYTVYERVGNSMSAHGGSNAWIVKASGLSATTVTFNNLAVGSTHTYAVAATAAGTESQWSAPLTVTLLAPQNPPNVHATTVTQTSVTLAWDASPGPVTIASYSIFEEIPRSFGPSSSVLKASNIKGTSGTVNGLQPNTTHFFFVKAYDAAGNSSSGSPSVKVTTNSSPVLTASFTPPNEIVAGVIGGKLQVVSPTKGLSAGRDLIISSNNLPAPTYSLVSGPQGMTIDKTSGKVSWSPVAGPTGTFSAKVRGTNSEGSGDLTFNFTVYAAGTDLLAPTAANITSVSKVTATGATITWAAATDNVAVTGYKVFLQSPPPGRGAPGHGGRAGGPVVEVGSVAGNVTTFNLTNLHAGTKYRVWVRAFDAAGNMAVPGDYKDFMTLPANSLASMSSFTSVSAASYSPEGLAAETIASAFGTNLATTIAIVDALPLPTDLEGTMVMVIDSAGEARIAPLFFVSPEQVNYQIPAGTSPGQAQVFIINDNGVTSTETMNVNSVGPGLFTANSSGTGAASAYVVRGLADGSQSYEAIAEYDSGQQKQVFLPIDFGPDLGTQSDQIYLVLFGTGLRARSSLDAVSIQISGADGQSLMTLPAEYAGAQGEFAGLDQVNLRLPRELIGQGVLNLTLVVDGKIANTVQIQIN